MKWLYTWWGRPRRQEYAVIELVLTHLHEIERNQRIMANDFTALKAAVTDLSAAVDKLVTSSDVQPQIDAVTTDITTLTGKIAAATPAPTA